MTPKEKAKELCENLALHIISKYESKEKYHKEYEATKQCALITVNELIEEHTWKNPISWNNVRKKYWQEVKTEIKKL